jgi:hypothetical protein
MLFVLAIFAIFCGNSSLVADGCAACSTEFFRLCILSLLLFRFFGRSSAAPSVPFRGKSIRNAFP